MQSPKKGTTNFFAIPERTYFSPVSQENCCICKLSVANIYLATPNQPSTFAFYPALSSPSPPKTFHNFWSLTTSPVVTWTSMNHDETVWCQAHRPIMKCPNVADGTEDWVAASVVSNPFILANPLTSLKFYPEYPFFLPIFPWRLLYPHNANMFATNE